MSNIANYALSLQRFLVDDSLSHNFVIEIDGVGVSAFRSQSGLKEIIKYQKIGALNTSVPISIKTGNIETPKIRLSQGIAIGDKLYRLYKKCRDWKKGEEDYRFSMSIVQTKLIRGIPIETDRVDLRKCYVTEYNISDHDALKPDNSIASIVIGSDDIIDKPLDELQSITDVAKIIAPLISRFAR